MEEEFEEKEESQARIAELEEAMAEHAGVVAKFEKVPELKLVSRGAGAGRGGRIWLW